MVYYLIHPADIDECLSQHSCHPDANCTNVKGSFNCTCKHGYLGNGSDCQGGSCWSSMVYDVGYSSTQY